MTATPRQYQGVVVSSRREIARGYTDDESEQQKNLVVEYSVDRADLGGGNFCLTGFDVHFFQVNIFMVAKASRIPRYGLCQDPDPGIPSCLEVRPSGSSPVALSPSWFFMRLK